MDQENSKSKEKTKLERLQKIFENYESHLMIVMFCITVGIIFFFGMMTQCCLQGLMPKDKSQKSIICSNHDIETNDSLIELEKNNQNLE